MGNNYGLFDNVVLDIVQLNPGITYIVQLEPELKFVFVNDNVEKITGYSPNDHYNDPRIGSKLIDKDSEEILKNGMQAALEGDSKPFLLKWRTKSDKLIWTQQQLVKYIYDDRLHVIGYVQDVTQLEEMKIELARLKKLVNICAYCNRIKHGNVWKDIQSYLQDNNNNKLSHGACPDCMRAELAKIPVE